MTVMFIFMIFYTPPILLITKWFNICHVFRVILDFFMVFCRPKNILKTSIIYFFFIYCDILHLSHLVDSIYDEPFASFTLSHLILNLPTKSNPLPSICLNKSLHSFMIQWHHQQIHQNRFQEQLLFSLILWIKISVSTLPALS